MISQNNFIPVLIHTVVGEDIRAGYLLLILNPTKERP
jgi:hypothetical protein